MMMSLSISAFAVDGVGNGGSDTANVVGAYEAGAATATVYSVDITWEGLEFTYNGAFEGTWNPVTHQYDGAVEAGWAEGSGKITVTNHSNTAITAAAEYEAATGYESASMNFSTDALEVGTADNGTDGAAGAAVTESITVTPAGTLPAGTADAVIGTITITIS